jgi:ABC-type polysaccharide/polyol phosphate export permease
MQFLKKGRIISVLTGLPPLVDASDRCQRIQRARWDIVQGLFLWELWTRLSLNEMRRRYKRTVLGPAWMTVSLLIFATAMSVVWAGLWNQKVSEFLPFLLSGLIPWTMIAGVIGESTGVFLGGEGLIKNQQFPYSILTYGVVARNLLIYFHNFLGYLLVALVCGVTLSPSLLLLVPGLILVIINCAWMSLLVATFCLRFRDFQQIVASLIQIIVFVTPIFWNVNQLQGDRAVIAHANLFYHMVEILRRPMLGEYPGAVSFLVCAVTAILGWWFAFRLFSSKRHRLPYWF